MSVRIGKIQISNFDRDGEMLLTLGGEAQYISRAEVMQVYTWMKGQLGIKDPLPAAPVSLNYAEPSLVVSKRRLGDMLDDTIEALNPGDTIDGRIIFALQHLYEKL